MVPIFSSNRSLSKEARDRMIEDHLQAFSQAVSHALESLAQTGTAADTTGRGSAALAGPGGGSSGSLAGDVIGTPGSNTVVKAQHTTLPVAVSPTDDEKFLRYQDATPAYELAFVTLAGDVSGTNPATVVDKARGIPLPLPVAGDDERALVYDHGTVAYVLRTFTTMTLLGAWTHTSILTLLVTDGEITNAFAGDTLLANVMPAAGFLEAIAIKLSGDVDGGAGAGNDVIATVYKNGSSTALTATVAGGAGTENEARAVVSPIAFAAGDDITVDMKSVGVVAAVRAAVQVWGRFAG